MIKRELQSKIKEQLAQFPVIAITGPRQSGKTTLAKKLLPDYAYFNLEDINTRRLAEEDPVAFLNSIEGKAIIDEIQKIPELLSQIQVVVDDSKETGQFVITGSESLLLSDKIAQSLAGRVVNNTLLPLSQKELNNSGKGIQDVYRQIVTGFYPRIYDTKVPFDQFYAEYLNTYVEKDVRQLQNIGDLSLFEKFLQLLAGRVGQLVNLTSLANDVGVSHNTIENWISLLEASYIVYRLKPYYKNLGKRVIKSPKVYFYDTGLLCYLLGIPSAKVLSTHFAVGNIYENSVINECMKYSFNNRLRSKFYFFRDSNKVEVDLLIESGTNHFGVEIKSAETFSSDFTKGLHSVSSIFDGNFRKFVIYRGAVEQSVSDVHLLNYASLKKLFRLLT